MKNYQKKFLKESKYYGVHACLALFQHRSKDIIKVYLESSLLKIFKEVLKWCAEHKKAYHIVDSSDLNKLTDSVHHEGVCILAKEHKIYSEEVLFQPFIKPQCFLYLDAIENPHNLGSIIRSAAHFNIEYIIGEKGKMPTLSPSCCRVAKGGAELVKMVLLSDPLKTLQKLKKQKFVLIGTSSHQGSSLYNFSFPKKSVLIMGSESFGISKNISPIIQKNICILGNPQVESLNVSVATALCLSKFYEGLL